ncbi:MAG: hypothetical protein HOP11_06300 [Saprospiraceae bacterium]|nr:hypothetical protein [Saprospiraceae bacterium]
MKKNLKIYSKSFRILSLAIPIAFIIISSLSPKEPINKQEAKIICENELLSCNQSDLNPCSYSSIESFVDALIAELNNQLNNCGMALVDCNQSLGPCCYDDALFTFNTQLSSGKNPYFYCTNQSCNSFTCIGLIGGGSQHNILTVADQNELLGRLRTAAITQGNIACNGSYGPIHKYEVFRTPPIGIPLGACSSDGPCFNLSIRMKVTYLCSCPN